MAARIGRWRPIPVGDGDALAIGGSRLAVASAARLEVVDTWSTARAAAASTAVAVDAPWPAPGVPRFHGGHVLWGPGVLHLATGRYRPLAAAAPRTWPGGGERPSVYAWSADGTRLLAGFNGRTVLLSADGALLGPVPSAAGGPAPTAAWVGRDRALVDLAEFGLRLMPIVAFSADAAERRLLAVALNQAVLSIDLQSGTVVDDWPGNWADAALAPGGALAAVLSSAGVVAVADLVNGRFAARTETGAPAGGGPPRAIAFDGSAVAVCGGGTVAVAEIDTGP